MIASYYFWNWANNDLPGRPAERLAGRLPPALAPFDARPLCTALDRLAARRRTEEWHREVTGESSGGDAAARRVFVTRATRGKRAPDTKALWQAVGPLGLSGCEESSARLATLGGQYKGEDLPTDRDPELLSYEDTLRLFERFHRGEPRPTDFPWRNINDLLG